MGDILSEVLGDASMSDIDRRAVMRRIVGLPSPLLAIDVPVLESAGLFVVRQGDAALAVGERQHPDRDPGDEILYNVEEALDIITEACKKLVDDHEAFSSLARWPVRGCNRSFFGRM
jgi:hypothetical protein